MLFFLSLIGERIQFIYCILILNLEWSAISSWSELDLVFFEKKQWQCCVLSPWIQEGSVPGQSTSLLRVLIVSIWFCCWLTASSSWHATFVLSSLVITYSREILCEYTWIAISDQMFNQHWPTLKVLVWIIHFCDSLRDWSQFPSFFFAFIDINWLFTPRTTFVFFPIDLFIPLINLCGLICWQHHSFWYPKSSVCRPLSDDFYLLIWFPCSFNIFLLFPFLWHTQQSLFQACPVFFCSSSGH